MSIVVHATVLLNCQCLICSKPLTDAKSVEIGIGPICRVKWGMLDSIPGGEPARERANRLIWEAACAKRDGNVDRVLAIADELLTMGLVKLATRIQARFVDLRIEQVEHNGAKWLDVFTPYRESFPYRLKLLVPADLIARVHVTELDGDGDPIYTRGAASNREIGGKFHHWCVHVDAARLLFGALAFSFAGERCASSIRGTFTIPGVEEFHRVYVDAALKNGQITESRAAYIRKRLPSVSTVPAVV